jgi:hypothetical protein
MGWGAGTRRPLAALYADEADGVVFERDARREDYRFVRPARAS